MTPLAANLTACHRCPFRQAACKGACACGKDGRDIIAHAEAGDCPVGRHLPPAARGLGDTVARVAHAIGADKLAQAWEHATGRPCGCKERQKQLNSLLPYKQAGSTQR